MEQKALLGGWSSWSFTPTKEAEKVFEQSLGKLLGVKYKMVAFASQVVNGTNYAFLCEAETVSPAGLDYVVMAYVYQPISGQPHITSIKSVGPKPNNLPGGWSNWQFAVTPKAKAVFTAATKGLLGVSYTPLAFTSQVVAGMNYCFLTEAKPVIPNATPYPAFVWVNQPLHGEPHIEEIEAIYPMTAVHPVASN